MATEVTVREFTNIPQPTRIITDIRSTPPRPGAARDPFFFVILGATELENIPFGGAVTRTGTSQRIQARERIFSDRLLAILQRDIPAREKATEILAATAPEDLPTDVEQIQQKRAVIQAAAPLALFEKVLDLEKIQREIDKSRELAAATIRLKAAQAERTRAEAGKRRAETEALIDLALVTADRETAEAELIRTQAAAEAIQPRLFDLATGGLDFFAKQVLARELTRIAAGERPFFAPVVRKRRVITSF